MAAAQRMNDIAAEAEYRTQRDPVLTTAIELILSTNSQMSLFQSIDGRPGAPQAPGAGGGPN